MKYDEFYFTESATPNTHKQYILYGSKDGRGYYLATFVDEANIILAAKSMNEANEEESRDNCN